MTSFLRLCDHDMIGIVRKLHNVKYQMKTVICRNYKNYDPNKLFSDVEKLDWSPVYLSGDVNVAVTYFNAKLKDCFDKHAPKIKKK